MGPRPLGPRRNRWAACASRQSLPIGEIDGLLVPSGKASKLLPGHLIAGKPLRSEPA